MYSFLRKSALTKRDLCFFGYPSLVRFISTDTATHSSSFVVSYLINTCGVPQEKAISASKKVHFKSSENPDLVLAYFKENGFSSTHISTVTGRYPRSLLCSVDKTLKPKFDFFKSQGISGSDFATVLCQDQYILKTSLERKIIPYFGIIKSVVHTDARLIALLKRTSRVLFQDPRKNLIPNFELLRAHGVPADNIAKFLVAQPRSFLIPSSSFSEIVLLVKQMKFDPLRYMFLLAVHGLTCMTKSSLEAKLDVYRSWGLSEDEVQFMFRKTPYCVMLSEKNIMSTMNYFVNEMGCTPSSIAKQPNVLLLSLTRRIIPRCTVIRILETKGLVGIDGSLSSYLQKPEEVFLKKYITRFDKEVPELLTTYQGKRRLKV